MLITTYSCHAHTLGVAPLQLQINISRGIKFHLLGIPARPGNEIRNRVYTALRSNGWRWPGQRIIIQYNPIDNGPYTQASQEAVDMYKRILEERRIVATVRHSRGQDIDAACGQLANKQGE